MVMVTIDGRYLDWDRILPITQNKHCWHVLYRDGVRGISLSVSVISIGFQSLILYDNRCTASHYNLDGPGGRRTHEHTAACFRAMNSKELWDNYSIIDGIMVRMIFP